MTTSPQERAREFTARELSRRGLLGGAVAAGAALTFGFAKTREIAAQQLTGTSLYDQLGGIVGISKVITDFVGVVAADDRINRFFAPTIAAGRVGRLQELLIQQVAAASGGPVTYTGGDMKTVHAGMGISVADFTALVEDLVVALDKNNVPDGPKTTLLGALAPMQGDIVELA
ncbi:MAG: group 1 truncated hemoglobin [Dehalococcoidia bacterium]